MPRRISLMVLAALTLVLSAAMAATMNPEIFRVLASLGGLVFLFAAPLWAARGIFDLIDKTMDRRIMPEVALERSWHLAYAALLGLIFLLVWTPLTVYLVNSPELPVRAWLSYIRPLEEINLAGYPAYAWYYGAWAGLTGMVGYLVELIFLLIRDKWVRRKKAENA